MIKGISLRHKIILVFNSSYNFHYQFLLWLVGHLLFFHFIAIKQFNIEKLWQCISKTGKVMQKLSITILPLSFPCDSPYLIETFEAGTEIPIVRSVIIRKLPIETMMFKSNKTMPFYCTMWESAQCKHFAVVQSVFHAPRYWVFQYLGASNKENRS